MLLLSWYLRGCMQVGQSSATDESMNILVVGPKVIKLFMLNSGELEISTANQN